MRRALPCCSGRPNASPAGIWIWPPLPVCGAGAAVTTGAASFLNDIAAAFEAADRAEAFAAGSSTSGRKSKSLLPGWKHLVAEAMKEELPVPAFSPALNYFYSLTICTTCLPIWCRRSVTISARIRLSGRMSCADSSFMRIGRDTGGGRRSRGLIMSEVPFCLDAKERYQRKNQGCTYGATPAASPAKGQELAQTACPSSRRRYSLRLTLLR